MHCKILGLGATSPDTKYFFFHIVHKQFIYIRSYFYYSDTIWIRYKRENYHKEKSTKVLRTPAIIF
jgi:hypothetical protein